MKTPSLLLLALAASLPSFAAAAAEAKPRCDVAWLTAAAATPSGAPVNDPKGYLTDVTVAGAASKAVKFSDKSALCDATVWHLLAIEAPANPDAPMIPGSGGQVVGGLALRWNDDGVKQAWAAGLADQIKILLEANALYQSVDPRGLAAIAKADAATAAAVKLGAASLKNGADLSKVKGIGYTSDAYAGMKAYTVEAAAGGAAPSPAELKASLSRLLKDSPAASAAKGPIPGPAVIAFRRAVIELANELATRGAGRELSAKYGVNALVTKDFALPPSGPRWVAIGPAAGAAAPGASAALNAAAAKDDVYAGALNFVTDPAITAGDDASAHDAAALSRLDYGLRNLIAIRAKAVQDAVDAAKKKLGTSSVKQALAALDHDAHAGPAPAGPLAADVLAKLQANPDYADLNRMYDGMPDKTTPEAKLAKDRIAGMQADAAATGVAGDKLQYSVGGKKLTDTGLRVADLKTDKSYQDFIAGVVADEIDSNPMDAKLRAALAAFRKNAPIAPPVTTGQQGVADHTLPPVPPPVNTPTTTWAAVLAATPTHWYTDIVDGRGVMERYRQGQLDGAAADAAAAGVKRQQAQANFDRTKAQLAVQQQREKADNAAKAQDPTWSPAAAANWLKAKNAAVDAAYAQKVEDARKRIVDQSGLPTAQQSQDALTAKQAAADAQVNAAYIDGIEQSVKQLQAEYKKSGSDQWSAEASASGYGRFYGNHLDQVDAYFAASWSGAALNASAVACRGGLWGSKTVRTGRGSYKSSFFNDPNPDNVDSTCVRAGLTAALRKQLGRLAPPQK